jgi:adenylate cyclase
MTDQRTRRLAAILMADIVGFSRMMGRDDEGTTERVVRFRSGVETLTESHGGRVVDTAGDSVFAVFESIVMALECATAIQQWLAKDDGEDRIMVRIGLHFGDVLVHDTSLFGDGVNIAAVSSNWRRQVASPPPTSSIRRWAPGSPSGMPDSTR